MITFARMNGDTVAEIVFAETLSDLRQRFHPEITDVCVPCSPEVQVGWLRTGNKFAAPIAIVPSLDAIKAAHVDTLRVACEAAITSGFKSSALGSPHIYPSDIKAQINLMGSVTDSIMPDLPTDWQTPFWVSDADGLWNWKMHGAAQIQQAGRDGKAHVVACQTLLAALTGTVLSAKTPEAVEAVIWPEGATA